MRRTDGQPPAPKGYGERAAYHHAYYLLNKRRYKQHREEQKDRRRAGEMLRRYGIGPEQFSLLMQAQGERCAICHAAFSTDHKDRTPHIDHLHEAGRPGRAGTIRGLLCNKCNKGLGHFKDNPEFLAEAITYLNAPPANVVLGTPVEQPRFELLEGEGA